MKIEGSVPLLRLLDETSYKPYKKDKSKNTPEFNKKAKKRRVKENMKAANRKKNRKRK